MTASVIPALERLLAIAEQGTGQSAEVANFLLAWWNPGECGRFEMKAMWMLDDAIVDDMAAVFRYIGKNKFYPDQLGYEERFKGLVEDWRPQLVETMTGIKRTESLLYTRIKDDTSLDAAAAKKELVNCNYQITVLRHRATIEVEYLIEFPSGERRWCLALRPDNI